MLIVNSHLIADSLHDFVIEAFTLTSSSPSVCEEVGSALKPYEKRQIACRPGTIGNIVRIRMTGTEERNFTLCAVEVYGGNAARTHARTHTRTHARTHTHTHLMYLY